MTHGAVVARWIWDTSSSWRWWCNNAY